MEKVGDEGGVKSPEFKNHKYGVSNWFQSPNYHGTGTN